MEVLEIMREREGGRRERPHLPPDPDIPPSATRPQPQPSAAKSKQFRARKLLFHGEREGEERERGREGGRERGIGRAAPTCIKSEKELLPVDVIPTATENSLRKSKTRGLIEMPPPPPR